MPVVTVTRSAGARGDSIAAALAERLEYRLVGRHELVQLASGAGFAESGLERSPEIRERPPSFWERLNEERRRYASVLRRTVTRLAAEDNVVIVGLGAGQVLRGVGHVLRVQIIAPVDLRIRRVMELGYEDDKPPMTFERARDVVRARDRDSAGYIRYMFNMDWTDPQNWDLVINTGRFTTEQAVSLLSTVVESGVLEASPEDRRHLEDLVINSEVESRLLNDPNVWVSNLRVWVEGGRVRLHGEVLTEEDREGVEEIVRRIDGVHHVDNDLHVQPPPLASM
jgi:CMP/dCMP kinase